MIEAQKAGQMNQDEFISTAMLILMAGHGSTIDVLGSGMHALLKFPDEMQRLRDDPGLMKTAVQEMFRYESPLPFFHRYVTQKMSRSAAELSARHQVRRSLRLRQPGSGTVSGRRYLSMWAGRPTGTLPLAAAPISASAITSPGSTWISSSQPC
jgi:hypothetical protein